MKENIKNILNATFFILFVIGGLSVISFWGLADGVIRSRVVAYEELEEDSIDIAFVGTSSSYRYYDVMDIWNEYGITSYSYALASLPIDNIIGMLETVRENQDPEVYVIDLRSTITQEYREKVYGYYQMESAVETTIRSFSLMPTSITKWSMIYDSDFLNGQEYSIALDPLYNHSTIQTNIKNAVFGDIIDTSGLLYQGNSQLSAEVANREKNYVDYSDVELKEYTLSEEITEKLTEIFDYCKENEMNVYFNFVPYVSSKNNYDPEIRNAIGELVTENGFAFTDYRADFEQFNFDLTTDFYDINHTNMLGATKYTEIAIKDILEAYPIETDYSDELVAEWDQSYEDWLIYRETKVLEIYQQVEEEANE